MENDANLDGSLMYSDASTEHHGVAEYNTAEKSTHIEDNASAENNNLMREVVPKTDDLLQSNSALQVEDAPEENGAPGEVEGPAEHGVLIENDATNEHDGANKNGAAEEKGRIEEIEDAEEKGMPGQSQADNINGTVRCFAHAEHTGHAAENKSRPLLKERSRGI